MFARETLHHEKASSKNLENESNCTFNLLLGLLHLLQPQKVALLILVSIFPRANEWMASATNNSYLYLVRYFTT